MTPDIVTAAKQRLEEGRAKLRSQHEAGSPGIQVCTRLTDLLDLVLLEIYEAVLEELGQPPVQNQIALVPHGGYGRADVAPYSDGDLMLLCAPEATEEVIPLETLRLGLRGDTFFQYLPEDVAEKLRQKPAE